MISSPIYSYNMLTNDELESRLNAAAAQFNRMQDTLDEILASQKDLRAKHDDLERQFRLKKQDLFSRYSILADLTKWFLDKIRKEVDELEMPQKIREEQKESEDKKYDSKRDAQS